MSQFVRKMLGVMTSMAVLVTVFSVGSQSFAPLPATGSTASTAPVAAPVGTLPANGFTDVAKAVTPAVVNITTVIGEKISGRGGENDSRDRMEEFFGGPNGPFGPKFRGPKVPKVRWIRAARVGSTEAGKAPASSCRRTVMCSPTIT